MRKDDHRLRLQWAYVPLVVSDVESTDNTIFYETRSKGQPGYYAYDTVTHGPLLGVIYKF